MLFLLAVLPLLAKASPLEKKWQASSYAGSIVSNTFPAAGVTPNTAAFPPESVVGYPGPTPTGAEPEAIETAPAYPPNSGAAATYPLVIGKPEGNSDAGFDISKYWGNLAPWYSVDSSAYGLNGASPLIPNQCSVTQVHLLYRHGARYPSGTAPPQAFQAKLYNATKTVSNLGFTGELDFLNSWEYRLGAELLTPFGRLQNFELGVAFRQQYGSLLNNFTEQKTLPVFTTESQDRMVKTALNFMAGMFGVPEYQDQVNLLIKIEATGFNNSGAPYYTCPNSNVASRGQQGSSAASAFANNAFNSTISRLNSQAHGITFTPSDAVAMLQLCSYETDALGYSAFCGLFTEEDFKNYEYYYDLSFYYNNGPGSPVSAAQGKGYLEQILARLQQHYITSSDSAVNYTTTNNPTDFPLNQSIYADATHEVVVLDTLTALNLTALFAGGPLNLNQRQDGASAFKASQVVPFGTHLVIQIMECSNMTPTKQARFIVNDAVVPIDQSYPGCPSNKDGLCPFDTVVSTLQKRANEINYDYDCNANYTSVLGKNYNGRAPSM